jgi:hypothetical protein
MSVEATGTDTDTDTGTCTSPARIHARNHARLSPEPLGLGLPLGLVARPLELEVAEHVRHELADLHRRDVLADAGAGAVAELYCIAM